MKPDAPIGVFDSGIGGLSVLRALQVELPHEDFVYVGDGGHSPYGERDDAHVLARSRAVIEYLRRTRGIKMMVVACNTATASAIAALRQEHPDLPVVGVEPALKPALSVTRTGGVGVMATRGTLASAKFQGLLQGLSDQARFVLQPCDGLADAIERESHTGQADDMVRLARQHVGALGAFGRGSGELDTLVLGCTHYPFAEQVLRDLVGPDVTLIETGPAVARQTRRLLEAANGLHAPPHPGSTTLLTTGDADRMASAFAHWIGPRLPATQVRID